MLFVGLRLCLISRGRTGAEGCCGGNPARGVLQVHRTWGLVRGSRQESQLPAPLPTAVWNFPRTKEHHLPLQIGEMVHILQASEGKGDPGCTPAWVPAPSFVPAAGARTPSLADDVPSPRRLVLRVLAPEQGCPGR